MTDHILTSDFVGFATPDIGDDEIDEVVETLRSGWVIAGPRVGAFERLLEDRLRVPQIRCLSSCTGGLLLALRCSGIGGGDEVLLPTITFAACANVVEQLGAVPVFVDSEPETGLMDLDHAASLVGPRTRALIAVHLGGRPMDIQRLNELRDRYGLFVVEDAAHAIGAAWGDRPVGAHGNPTSFSFHASKNMTTLEGGALALEGEAMAERVGRLARQGISQSAWDRHGSRGPADYDLIEPGYKLAMTDVQAAIGIHQLRKLDEGIDRREEIRCAYDAELSGLELELEPDVEPGVRHARHLYRVQVRPEAACTRDELIAGLRARGVGCSAHFKPLHTLTYYANRYGLAADGLPAGLAYGSRTVSLPLYPGLSESDQQRVIEGVADLVRGGAA